MRVITWILANRFLVLLVTAALAINGAWAWTRLPIDAFPDVTNTQVMVLAKAPGLAAMDVEARVSFPIEQHLRGLPRVLLPDFDYAQRPPETPAAPADAPPLPPFSPSSSRRGPARGEGPGGRPSASGVSAARARS